MRPFPTGDKVRSTAASYMKGQLQRGKKFASLVLETLDFEHGEFGVLVADGYSEKDLVELDTGHLLGEGPPRRLNVGNLSGVALLKPTADAELADFISEKLQASGRYCLLENYLAAPQDPVLRKARSRIAVCGSDVYHLLVHEDSRTISVANAIREARSSPTFLGASGAVADTTRYQSTGINLNMEELRVLAVSVDVVFVSAYDAEGYLCWLKRHRV